MNREDLDLSNFENAPGFEIIEETDTTTRCRYDGLTVFKIYWDLGASDFAWHQYSMNMLKDKGLTRQQMSDIAMDYYESIRFKRTPERLELCWEWFNTWNCKQILNGVYN